jgi:hypothetical protein
MNNNKPKQQKDHVKQLAEQSRLTTEFQAAYSELTRTKSVSKAIEVEKLGERLLAVEEETGVKMLPTTFHKTLIARDIVSKKVTNVMDEERWTFETKANGDKVWKLK